MYKITEVTPGEGLTLHLRYNDDTTIHADVSGLLQGDPGVFAPLADRAFFEQVSIMRRGRGVTWPGELDLDGDTLRMPDHNPEKPPVFRILKSTEGAPLDPVSLLLREAVLNSGLTQTEIAERADMQQPNLARLLDPLYHGHSLNAVRQVATALGLQVQLQLTRLEATAAHQKRS